MLLGLETVKPPNLDIIPTSANFTIPGQVKVYVLDTKKNATVLAFTLGSVSICSSCYYHKTSTKVGKTFYCLLVLVKEIMYINW